MSAFRHLPALMIVAGLPLAAPALAQMTDATPRAALAQPDRTCLDKAAAADAVRIGRARRLTDLRGAVEGEILRAELCRDGSGYVYLVTSVLAGGRVKRALVDANPSLAAEPGYNTRMVPLPGARPAADGDQQ